MLWAHVQVTDADRRQRQRRQGRPTRDKQERRGERWGGSSAACERGRGKQEAQGWEQGSCCLEGPPHVLYAPSGGDLWCCILCMCVWGGWVVCIMFFFGGGVGGEGRGLCVCVCVFVRGRRSRVEVDSLFCWFTYREERHPRPPSLAANAADIHKVPTVKYQKARSV
jgi:hypothetical protein